MNKKYTSDRHYINIDKPTNIEIDRKNKKNVTGNKTRHPIDIN